MTNYARSSQFSVEVTRGNGSTAKAAVPYAGPIIGSIPITGFMNTIYQHIPGFVDCDEPPDIIDFSSTEELLNIDWIKSWAEDSDFVRFSKSKNLLMVELKDKFYVLGYIKNPKDVELPTWKV